MKKIFLKNFDKKMRCRHPMPSSANKTIGLHSKSLYFASVMPKFFFNFLPSTHKSILKNIGSDQIWTGDLISYKNTKMVLCKNADFWLLIARLRLNIFSPNLFYFGEILALQFFVSFYLDWRNSFWVRTNWIFTPL